MTVRSTEVRIFEGEVVQMDPDFNAAGNGVEYYPHQTQEAAEKDADAERDRSLAAGWLLLPRQQSVAGA